MLANKLLKSLPIQETNARNGSGGGTNCGEFTFPFPQSNPVDSTLYFNALQYRQTIDIPQIVTDLSVQ